jgi:hypothetical protein
LSSLKGGRWLSPWESRGSGQRDKLSQKKTGILTGYLIDIRRSKAKRGVPVGTWGVHKVVLPIHNCRSRILVTFGTYGIVDMGWRGCSDRPGTAPGEVTGYPKPATPSEVAVSEYRAVTHLCVSLIVRRFFRAQRRVPVSLKWQSSIAVTTRTLKLRG